MVKFCCDDMKYILESSNEIRYDPRCRSFIARFATSRGTQVNLKFCPWCGTNLPTNLGSKWIEVLKEEYRLTDPIFDDAAKVPEEFKTETWWRKRGL